MAACADRDPVAAGILRAAARHMADSAAAVCPAAGEPRVALTGGLLKMGDPLLVPLEEELAKRLPHARHVPAAGDPLHGAVRIATDLATGGLTLPSDDVMLCVTERKGGANSALRRAGSALQVTQSDKSGRIPLTCTLPEQGSPRNQ